VARGPQQRALRDLLARDSTPANPGWLHRAEAYLSDALGLPERALRQLWLAEQAAQAFHQPLDAALARYQRGLRLGADQGRALREQARAAVRHRGAAGRLLDEDVALR
jgi:hypothetical protein